MMKMAVVYTTVITLTATTRVHVAKVFSFTAMHITVSVRPCVCVFFSVYTSLSTLCLKKVPTFKLSVTLSHLNRFVKIFVLLESVWNLLQNPYDNTHLTLGMLLRYLGKLKIQIFCRYSADMEESANKSHFVSANFVLHPHILIFSCLT